MTSGSPLTPTVTTTLHNPYWDKVKHLYTMPPEDPFQRFVQGHSPQIGSISNHDSFTEVFQLRQELVPQYAWSVPDPGAIEFVAQHSGHRILDPLAGTGYWAYLLHQAGVRCLSSDISPAQPANVENHWHPATKSWVNILQRDAEEAIRVASATALYPFTLLLSWSPMDDTSARVLNAFTGNTVIHIGEGPGGCTDSDAFFDQLFEQWEETALYLNPQFPGLHDMITVWTRKKNLPAR